MLVQNYKIQRRHVQLTKQVNIKTGTTNISKKCTKVRSNGNGRTIMMLVLLEVKQV